MTYIEKAIQIVKNECYVNDPLNLDRSIMINEALDILIGVAKRYDESEDKDNGRRE